MFISMKKKLTRFFDMVPPKLSNHLGACPLTFYFIFNTYLNIASLMSVNRYKPINI